MPNMTVTLTQDEIKEAIQAYLEKKGVPGGGSIELRVFQGQRDDVSISAVISWKAIPTLDEMRTQSEQQGRAGANPPGASNGRRLSRP